MRSRPPVRADNVRAMMFGTRRGAAGHRLHYGRLVDPKVRIVDTFRPSRPHTYPAAAVNGGTVKPEPSSSFSAQARAMPGKIRLCGAQEMNKPISRRSADRFRPRDSPAFADDVAVQAQIEALARVHRRTARPTGCPANHRSQAHRALTSQLGHRKLPPGSAADLHQSPDDHGRRRPLLDFVSCERADGRSVVR